MRRLAFFTTFSLVLYFTAKTMAADDWTQKSPSTKPSARSRHAMAYIGDDKVILYGGLTTGGVKNGETWIYDLSENAWTQMSNPGVRYDHAMAYLGGDQVLMFGGCDASQNKTSSCWKYDLSNNTWTETNPNNRPGARCYHAMAYIGDGKVLMVGGEHESGPYVDETWLYETSSNTWTSKSGLGFGMFLHSLAYIGDDKALLAGIRKSDGVINDVYLFDLSENAWTQKTDLPETRANGAMVYIGGLQTMFFGGYDSGWWTKNTTYIYSLNNNTWTTDNNSSAPSERIEHRMAETSMDGTGYIVLFGGDVNGTKNDETWTFGGGDYSLPVELTTLTAKSQSGGILLNWITESETENLGFVLEKRILDTGIWLLVADYRTDESLQGHGSTSAKHEYQYTDKAVQQGATYLYRLADVDYSGKVKWHKEVEVKVEAESAQLAEVFRLGKVYPNPLNATFTIPLTLGKTSPVKLSLYDINGRLVKIIEDGIRPAGEYHIAVDCGKMSSGIYLLQSDILHKIHTRKVVLLK